MLDKTRRDVNNVAIKENGRISASVGMIFFKGLSMHLGADLVVKSSVGFSGDVSVGLRTLSKIHIIFDYRKRKNHT